MYKMALIGVRNGWALLVAVVATAIAKDKGKGVQERVSRREEAEVKL